MIPATRRIRIGLTFLAFFVVGCAGFTAHAQARQDSTKADSLRVVVLPTTVVTATRTAYDLRDVPIPTRVVGREEIARRAPLRLSDLLAEQPGLMLVHDHGAGIQMQGFDSDYTLILIDGQPVIGRTAGTLDLSRFSIEDIEHVEIVQGPSSSIYGSDALAGVINIRTRRAQPGLQARGGLRLQTNDSRDLSATISGGTGVLESRLSYNRFSTAGYDLHPERTGLTGPGFASQTASARLGLSGQGSFKASIGARFAHENQQNILSTSQVGTYKEEASRTDWSVNPQASWRITSRQRVGIDVFASGYRTRTAQVQETESSNARFQQSYRKAELQHDLITRKFLTNLGVGVIEETVKADRILGDKRSNQTLYAFLQHQWLMSEAFQINVSSRLDVHSEYDARMTPKAAIMWKPREDLTIRASVGTGFKAPTFQQLYLDFTNPVAGYSVVGSGDAAGVLEQMHQQGQIATWYTQVDGLETVGPESSTAFNMGLHFAPVNRVDMELSVFRNQVRDLIETLPVAAKTNGQNVFTYVNLSQIYTQGGLVELRFRPSSRLSISTGYQFLDARDLDVLDDIDAGRMYRREGGVDQRLSRADYGGLFNRSRHSGTVAVSWRPHPSNVQVSLRGTYRGRYGFGDTNGNLILDDDSEYVDGHMLWNVTFTKPVGDSLTLRTGVENIFDHTNAVFIPSLPGRLIFVGVTLSMDTSP